jgi:hypothetical protein
VAKERKSQQPSSPTSQLPEKTRVTAYLDPVGSAVFSSLCDLWGKNAGDGLTMMVWAAFNGLESGQREAVAGMVRAKTGLSRLPSGPKTQKTVEGGQQGSGGATGSDMLANRLADIQTRAVDAPIGDALASLYGN